MPASVSRGSRRAPSAVRPFRGAVTRGALSWPGHVAMPRPPTVLFVDSPAHAAGVSCGRRTARFALQGEQCLGDDGVVVGAEPAPVLAVGQDLLRAADAAEVPAAA